MQARLIAAQGASAPTASVSAPVTVTFKDPVGVTTVPAVIVASATRHSSVCFMPSKLSMIGPVGVVRPMPQATAPTPPVPPATPPAPEPPAEDPPLALPPAADPPSPAPPLALPPAADPPSPAP